MLDVLCIYNWWLSNVRGNECRGAKVLDFHWIIITDLTLVRDIYTFNATCNPF